MCSVINYFCHDFRLLVTFFDIAYSRTCSEMQLGLHVCVLNVISESRFLIIIAINSTTSCDECRLGCHQSVKSSTKDRFFKWVHVWVFCMIVKVLWKKRYRRVVETYCFIGPVVQRTFTLTIYQTLLTIGVSAVSFTCYTELSDGVCQTNHRMTVFPLNNLQHITTKVWPDKMDCKNNLCTTKKYKLSCVTT